MPGIILEARGRPLENLLTPFGPLPRLAYLPPPQLCLSLASISCHLKELLPDYSFFLSLTPSLSLSSSRPFSLRF